MEIYNVALRSIAGNVLCVSFKHSGQIKACILACEMSVEVTTDKNHFSICLKCLSLARTFTV